MDKFKKLDQLIDEYENRLNTVYPRMQMPGTDLAIQHLEVCLIKNKHVEDLYPKIYGSAEGRLI